MGTEKELKFHIENIGQFVSIYNMVNEIYAVRLFSGPVLTYVDHYFEKDDDKFRVRIYFDNLQKVQRRVLTRKSEPVMQDGFMVRTEVERDISDIEYGDIFDECTLALRLKCTRELVFVTSTKDNANLAEMSLDTVECEGLREQFVEIELKEGSSLDMRGRIPWNLSRLIADQSKREIMLAKLASRKE